MLWLNHLDVEALLAFNLILGVAMAVILLVTRFGLGAAARRVDVWLAGSALLLLARLAPEVEQAFAALPPQGAALDLRYPLIMAGLYWQAEGLRLLGRGNRRPVRIVLISLALALAAGLVQRYLGERLLPLLFAGVDLLLVRNAMRMSRRFWGARLLAAAALVLLMFNGIEITAGGASVDQIARRGLLLEMVWALFGTAGFLQCLYQDIRDQLATIAVTDALTGALNRTGLMPLLHRDIEHARRGGDVAVALCDLDHFKRINDTHGHAAGDQVLQRFVAQARACLRRTDLVGRVGGEEFLLVMPRSGLDEAIAVTERIRAALAGSADAPAFTFSAGIASAGESPVRHDLERLLATADRRLYVAKRERDKAVAVDVA